MRTTIDSVKEIIDTDIDEDSIYGIIGSANVFVTSYLTGKGLADDLLKEIEKWVAAHMIASSRERFSKEEGAGGAYIRYAGTFGEGLLATSYGQVAITLDTSGTLLAIAKNKQKATTFAIPSFE